MLFIAVNSPNFVHQEGGWEDSKVSEQFLLRLYIVSHLFFEPGNFLFSVFQINICFKRDFDIAYLFSLSIYLPSCPKEDCLLYRG